MTIEELLNTAKERGASDLHVTVGIPPKIRVNGELTDMDYPRMLPQDVEAVIKPTMSDFQRDNMGIIIRIDRVNQRGKRGRFSAPGRSRHQHKPPLFSCQPTARFIVFSPPHQQQQIRIQLASVLEAVVSQQLIPLQNGRGRVAAFEVMHATIAVKNLIREAKTHQIDSIIQTSRKLGMQTMDDAIYELYLKRKIDAERALTFAQDPAALERKLY